MSDFREARWWAPPEAFWKIAGFTVHKQMPPVTRVRIHLQHQQNVFGDFNDMQPEELRALAEKTERSQLQQWFALNKRERRNPGGYEEGTAAPDLLYTEIPRYYRWDQETLQWIRRKNTSKMFPTVSRMYTVHVKDRERYYFRRLLFYVRGPISFDDVRNVDGELCTTYRDACLARNLLADDNEWKSCMDENKDDLMPGQLRHLLFQIFVECKPSNPFELFKQYSAELSEDYMNRLCKPDDKEQAREKNRQDAVHQALFDIETLLVSAGDTLDEAFLTEEYQAWKDKRKNAHAEDNVQRFVREELEYDAETESKRANQMYETMNEEQRDVFNVVMAMVHDREEK